MQVRKDFELIESLVQLDPLEDGFAGVLLKVYRYVLLEVASTAGNRLLRLSFEDGRVNLLRFRP